MDANQLLFYLRGLFENVPELSATQISAIRNEVLRAKLVEAQIIPVEVVNPIKQVTSARDSHGKCGGCGGT